MEVRHWDEEQDLHSCPGIRRREIVVHSCPGIGRREIVVHSCPGIRRRRILVQGLLLATLREMSNQCQDSLCIRHSVVARPLAYMNKASASWYPRHCMSGRAGSATFPASCTCDAFPLVFHTFNILQQNRPAPTTPQKEKCQQQNTGICSRCPGSCTCPGSNFAIALHSKTPTTN
eukprot:1156390-Pelagomonas_calceolata.AAC.8